jgi:hypothetical protein
MGDAQLADLQKLVSRHPDCAETKPMKLSNTLQAFVDANEEVGSSPNYQNQNGDRLDEVMSLVSKPAVQKNCEVLLRVLKALKILSRKYDNRARLGPHIVGPLVEVLHQRPQALVAGEAANVILNICYERENVTLIMENGGVPPLVALLREPEQELQANAAGAIQSICFQKEGRRFVRELGAVPAVLPLLSSPSLKVRTRAVGAIHNISSEAEAIRVIRRLHGIGPLVDLLRAPSATVCGSAAGALQNLSRESSSREEIRELGAVIPLSDLLLGEDVQAQVCAAGAILNVLGPDLGPENAGNEQRVAFKKLLSLAITVGMVRGSITDASALAQGVSSSPPAHA